MKKVICLLVAISLLLCISPLPVVIAGAQDFTIVNATGYDIADVYVSASKADTWGDDLMGQDILPNGDSVKIVFDKAETQPVWDLKVKYTDGTEVVWYDLDLMKISKVTLKYDAAANVTSAAIE